MQVPDFLHTLPDGLHGDIDTFMAELASGRLAAQYAALEANNALKPGKIECWLTSESYEDRQNGRHGGIPGCTVGQ